jgi:hypothetical integral membrane protein (TIGR02206 family)
MATDFVFFGPLHFAILASTVLAAGGLFLLTRHHPDWILWTRRALGVFLLLASAVWWGYQWMIEGFTFPGRLPLNLCDWSLVATGVAALTLRPRWIEFAYYLGLIGAAMALLTPDLWGPLATFRNIHFFIAHGAIVSTVLYLAWTGHVRLDRGSIGRTFLILNLIALPVGLFDWAFGANYLYLRAKPASGSLMDAFGPWPWYLLVLELVALGLFCLLWIPVRARR